MRLFKFRALLTLAPADPADPAGQARQSPSGTHSLMVRSGRPGQRRCFPAAIYRLDERPLKPGDSGVLATIEIADDDAGTILGPGQRITLWNGADVGHGVISRRVFFTWAA